MNQHITISQSRPFAVFMGIPTRVEAAYPSDLRNEIAGRLNVLGPVIPGDEWEAHRDALGRAEVIMATWGMPRMTADFLAAAPKLKAVFYAAGSVKGFVTDEAYGREILIVSARMANAVPVAEYAMATIVLSLKRFWSYARMTREDHVWDRNIPVAGTYRATIGLVSLGATGRYTAERLARLDCNVIAYDPFVGAEAARELGVNLVSLEELFRISDVVSIHAPLLPETTGLINGRLVASMKSGATLINTSRGAVVAEAELVDVLNVRFDLTAILDVVESEPLNPQSPLFTLPNAVLTPHISGSMGKEIEMMGRWMYADLTQYLSNRPLAHTVRKEMLAQMA
jgi:phosphoglycerate dehydrogenase-like enzyme